MPERVVGQHGDLACGGRDGLRLADTSREAAEERPQRRVGAPDRYGGKPQQGRSPVAGAPGFRRQRRIWVRSTPRIACSVPRTSNAGALAEWALCREAGSFWPAGQRYSSAASESPRSARRRRPPWPDRRHTARAPGSGRRCAPPEHSAVSSPSRSMASLNIGSVRNRSASLPSS